MSESVLARPLSTKFDEALAFAVELHRAQARKGTQIPYVSHLLGVASTVLEQGGTETEAIGALLHDAVEDQPGDPSDPTAERIRRTFGDDVLAIVEGCSDSRGTNKPPWWKRKEDYVAHLPAASASIRIVSAADKLYNARTILKDLRASGDQLWNRFTATREQTLWYYAALVKAFRAGGTSPLIEELVAVVGDLLRAAGSGDPLACSACKGPVAARWAPFCSEACQRERGPQ